MIKRTPNDLISACRDGFVVNVDIFYSWLRYGNGKLMLDVLKIGEFGDIIT